MDYKVFGCKTNRYFAEKWLSHQYLSDKKGYFIASCIVTDRAKAKWLKHAKKQLTKLKKHEVLYLSGCGTTLDGKTDPSFYTIYPELADFRENIELLPENPDDFQMTRDKKITHIKTKIHNLQKLTRKSLFTRKFIVIQSGCDNFCTFCLTVKARGRHKWRSQENIIAEIQECIGNGGKEVVFTGINLGAWGAPSSNQYTLSRIADLIETVLEKTTIERLRVSSLGVEFLSEKLIQLFRNPRINAYIHISIQSGSSKILRAMHRNYDGDTVRKVLEKLQHLEREDGIPINIGADMIVGFPGETDKDYLETEKLVQDFEISQLHVFPFSPHVSHYSVPAGSFPDQVPNHICQERAKKLISVGNESYKKFCTRNIGKNVQILIEKCSKDSLDQNISEKIPFSGWTQNYLFCDETNFEPLSEQGIQRGKIVHGIYRAIHSTQKRYEDFAN